MIPKEKELKLIKIYMYICDIYQSSLKFYCQRFSNNATPIFTDQELLTVYLFCGAYQRYFQIKEIHTFTEEYLLSWFPNLPSYQTFNYRLNLMSEAISELVKHLITFFKPEDCDSMTSLIDSMPIITCAGKNKTGKVATEIATKGYCSTKNMYYFGLKLHALAFRREGTRTRNYYANSRESNKRRGTSYYSKRESWKRTVLYCCFKGQTAYRSVFQLAE